jgi:hypothetical protein
MPDIRKHRGAHPEDRKLFAADQLLVLRTAVDELSWLLTRDYSLKGAVKLVGDRYELTDRQRLGISRAACSDQSRQRRAATLVGAENISHADVIIDGFNLVVTTEAALSGGLVIRCRDGCVRDLSSVHGSYRAVSETDAAIKLVGEELAQLRPASALWLLDKPISNSGRLAKRIRDLALQNKWNWTVEVVFNPDAEIAKAGQIAITSDSHLLDQVTSWLNLNQYLLEKRLASAWLIDLS